MTDFEPWPKIPRWNRNVVVTEKIDGTNAAILVEPKPLGASLAEDANRLAVVLGDDLDDDGLPGTEFHVYAQSRTRFITPGVGREAGRDNYGFAAWVQENAAALVGLLGPGRHFGEWYGQGIARGYGLDHRRFALFNVHRWSEDARGYDGHPYQLVPGLPVDVVPTLTTRANPVGAVTEGIDVLLEKGSVLAPGFDRPEGVVVYHTAAKQLFKVLLEGDELPKGLQTRQERTSWGVYDA